MIEAILTFVAFFSFYIWFAKAASGLLVTRLAVIHCPEHAAIAR
jgi:hypothetical protein